jgi:4-azaleucine resistance transporter AzlC
VFSSPRSQFLSGLRAVFPMVPGMIPFAMISGIAAVETGLSPSLAMAMSVLIFAGASQLAALQLVAQAAPLAVIVLTALVINLRFSMYSASLAPYFRTLSMKWKSLIAYLLTDPAYGISITRFRHFPGLANRHWFYLGVAASTWLIWQFFTAAGVFLGTRVPTNWSLDFAIPLMFIALAVPALHDRATIAAGLTSALVSVLVFHLPLNLGLIVAAGTGILIGVLVEQWQQDGAVS